MKNIKKLRRVTAMFFITTLIIIGIAIRFVFFAFKEEVKEIKKDDTNFVYVTQIEKNIEPVPIVSKEELPFRLTSYWVNDTVVTLVDGTKKVFTTGTTGSGLSKKSFQVNDKGWYTYNGKIVLAAATNECLRSHSGACGKWNTPIAGKHYFNYYDELEIAIDGITYTGIVLDSCGACMFVKHEERLDLFVSSSAYAIDRGYRGNNPVSVFLEDK